MPMSRLLREVMDALPGMGGFKLGLFRLKLHDKNPEAPLSPVYFNLRFLQSYPVLLQRTAMVYVEVILRQGLVFDRLAPVPVAAMPIATMIGFLLGKPMITPRLAPKGHGEPGQIDGVYEEGETALLIDDLITDATSKLEVVEVLRDKGLIVKDVVVLLDRQQGGREGLAKEGITLHAAISSQELLDHYEQAGRISSEARLICRRYQAGNLPPKWEATEVEEGWDRIS